MSVVTGGSEPGPAATAAATAGGGAGGGTRVFFQSPRGSASREDSVSPAVVQVQQQRRHQQGKVTVKYDRKELRKRLVLEEWIVEQLGQLYGCEVPARCRAPSQPDLALKARPNRGKPRARRGAEAARATPLTVRLPPPRREES